MMLVKGKRYLHRYPPLISEWLFDKVQAIIANHHKVPLQYAGKPMLFRGMIQCTACGCTVTGDTKKQKYTYYSCNNSKRICKKKWIREEKLIAQLMNYFKAMQLSDKEIKELVTYLQGWENKEQEFKQKTLVILVEKLEQISTRLSRLIDMHIDGAIDPETYHLKLDEYKREKQRLTHEVESFNNAHQSEIVSARDVLELLRDIKEIFESSNLDEKQQFLNLFFSNLQLNSEKLDVELREPFSLLVKTPDQPIWRD